MGSLCHSPVALTWIAWGSVGTNEEEDDGLQQGGGDSGGEKCGFLDVLKVHPVSWITGHKRQL